jgi:hypothetical protein
MSMATPKEQPMKTCILSMLLNPGEICNGTAYFVNFYTSKGMFQLAVYDSHNGYYGHSFYIVEE